MPVGCYKQMSTIKEGVTYNEVAVYIDPIARNSVILQSILTEIYK